MNRRFIALGSLCCLSVVAVVRWWMEHSGPVPENLLAANDLTNTSVTYSWSGFCTFEGIVDDVSAVFQGDGTAILRLGDQETVETTISPERFRELLRTMADNDFATIATKRRWRMYVADIGRLEVALKADGRQTVVYADGKHYVDAPERLQAILDKIYSFEEEFGQPVDYGPVASTTMSDYREWAMAGSLIGVLVLGGIVIFSCFRRRR